MASRLIERSPRPCADAKVRFSSFSKRFVSPAAVSFAWYAVATFKPRGQDLPRRCTPAPRRLRPSP